MRRQQILLALWASVTPVCFGITISPLVGAGITRNVLFGNSGDMYFQGSSSSADPSAIRTFTDGPFGMGKGLILSTGSLTSPLAPGDTCPSSYTTDLYDKYTQNILCGPDSYNGASFSVTFIPTKATTLLIDLVIASCDTTSGDKVMVTLNGVNYAKDENNTPLDSSSKYLSEPWGIPAPNGDTAFAMSSPPLQFSIPLPKAIGELRIAICDRLDGYGDTAVMIKARPCNNCDQPFKVDYDTTSIVSTATYETISTITQQASGTARGTISYVTYVTISATSIASTPLSDSTSVAPSETFSEPALSTSSEGVFSTTSTLSTSFITSTLATITSATTPATTSADTTLPDTVIQVATSEDATSAATNSVSSETPSSTASTRLESETTLSSTPESISTSVSSEPASTFTTLSHHTTAVTSQLASSMTESVTLSGFVSISISEVSPEFTSTETPSPSSTRLPGPCRPRRSR